MADLFKDLESQDEGTVVRLTTVLDGLKYNADGLVPAIAQDVDSGQVLMLAWMNRTAIERTLDEGLVCYYSRSRKSLWQKGETSGHFQALQEMRFDCDGDAIVLRVQQTGVACHTERESCFYLQVDDDQVRVISGPR